MGVKFVLGATIEKDSLTGLTQGLRQYIPCNWSLARQVAWH